MYYKTQIIFLLGYLDEPLMNIKKKIIVIAAFAVLLISNSVSIGAFYTRTTNFCEHSNSYLRYNPLLKIEADAATSNNRDAPILICFKDHLYMGTHNPEDGCELYRSIDAEHWEKIVGKGADIPNGFGKRSNCAIWSGKVFGDHLYFGTINLIHGCEIWRSSDGVNWTAVVGGDSKTIGGFGGILHFLNYYAWCMEEFNGKLYVGTFNFFLGGQIWASSDGVNWTRVIGGINKKPTGNGFGDRANYGIRTLKTFNGSLYAGTATHPLKLFRGCEIWRTSDGNNWTKVDKDGFGSFRNVYAWSIEEVNGSLYVGTINLKNGCELWRTSDGSSWEQVASGGIIDKNNVGARKIAVFQGDIYVGICNLVDGCVILRSKDDGVTWNQTNENGFGNNRNWAVRQFTLFNDELYTGVWNQKGYSLIKYDGVQWTKIDVEAL